MKILKFTAPWCSACKTLGATLERLAAEFPAIEIEEIDIDKMPNAAIEHHVTGLPTLIIGDLRLTSNIGYSQLRAHIKSALEAKGAA